MLIAKPLLASPVDLDILRFPVLTSPKLDGIRAIVQNGRLLSRKLLPIPNEYIQGIATTFPNGLDGELMTYDADWMPHDFNTIQGNVMRKSGQPNFRFVVFDDSTHPVLAFALRLKSAHSKSADNIYLRPLHHEMVSNVAELIAAEEQALKLGYEGLMIRDPAGRYKYGRSTAKEQILLKMKRFFDAEATVTGMVELMSNQNEKLRDELGHAKRSSAKAGKVPAGVMGTLVCDFDGVQFEIGTGFDAALRKHFWDNPGEIVGQRVTFKYQELTPAGVPRFPVFVGIRRDL